ncbi:MAG: hypothetical protein AAF471_08345, partial [Myxococcota bacterium]
GFAGLFATEGAKGLAEGGKRWRTALLFLRNEKQTGTARKLAEQGAARSSGAQKGRRRRLLWLLAPNAVRGEERTRPAARVSLGLPLRVLRLAVAFLTGHA